MSTTTWVPDTAALVAALADADAPVPVLAPDRPSRLRHWTEVLDWYQREPPVRHSGDELVVCRTEEFASVAEAFAARTGRGYLAGWRDAGWVRSCSGAAAVTVVGRCDAFPVAALHDLAETIDAPWALLPALDLAGLSFAVAKTLLAPPTDVPDWVVADVIGGATGTGDVVGLLTGGARALALCAHGENGHANLGSHVLCGLPREAERGLDGGAVTAGCVDGTRCKRGRGRPVLRTRDVRAADLLLFSCTTFSVAGDLFPSDISLVTAALEGYARSVLSCDRAMPYRPASVEALARLTRLVGMSGIREIENDFQLPLLGSRPYYLAGAAGAPDLTAAPCVPGEPLDTREKVTLARRQDDSAVLLAEPAGQTLFPGNRFLRIVATGEPEEKTVVTDATDRLREHERWQHDLATRLDRTARLHRAVRDLAAPDGDALTSLAAMVRTHDDLGRLLQGSVRVVEQARRTGVWRAEVERLPGIAARYGARWARSCVALFDTWLLQHHALEQVLCDGLYEVSTQRDGHCDHCGSPRYVTGHAAPGDDADRAGVFLAQCPHCGPREVWEPGGPRLTVTLPTTVLAGSVLPVGLASASRGPVVLHGKDNGGDAVYAAVRLPGPGGAVELRVPAGLPADMHTVRVVLATDLRLTYQRLRLPCTG